MVILLDNYDKFEKKFGRYYNVIKKHSNYILLMILMLIVGIITYYRVMIQIEVGPIWDTCDFLSNALLFAGQGTGYADLTRPPFLSFLTSIFFRLGYVSPTVIFALDGVIFVFGVIGFYLVLNARFNGMQSFLGALLFATFPIVLLFVGSGLTDVPSLSLSIWAIYFTVMAVKKDSKFFYLAFPFLVLAFLTRYAIAFVIFPMLLYILINKKLVKDIKYVLIGIFASVLLIIPVLLFFYSTFGNPIYSFVMFFGLTTTSSPISPENFAYHPNLLYFILNSPTYLGSIGFTFLLTIFFGFLVYIFIKLRKGKLVIKNPLKYSLYVENSFTKLKLLIILILIIMFVGTFGKITYMITELIFFALLWLAYDFLKNRDMENMDLNFLFLSWFMAFFIFHSVYVIKDGRYFLTMTPAISYFLILGLTGISNKLTYGLKNRKVISYLFVILLAGLMLLSTSYYLLDLKKPQSNIEIMNEDMISASQWLVNYDADYMNKTVYSDEWPYTGWYLKMHVGMMPIFKDNQKFYCGVKDYSFNSNDNKAFNNYLESKNVEYYFCVRKGLNLTHYTPIKQFGDVIIYVKEQ